MALYEYRCAAHGLFEARRPLADYAAPSACPTCGTASPRVLMTPPRLGTSERGMVKAHAANERAADSPKRASTHGANGSCCSGGGRGQAGARNGPEAAKSFPGRRPWMISH